jgi:2-succinyl-5-enolpyruvyl-6-hydroxy-3-cyclohexene-1-carboxylate synthase
MALARSGRFTLRVHLDERSAAFFALGVGKASGRPAAVVTTSGSAVANLFPAVVEAAQAETPLLVLTADRPTRLRGADANQAIDQVRFFGPYVRGFFDAGAPTADGPELRHLRVTADRAVALASGPPAGPVHVNLPFDKPLEPTEEGLEDLGATHPLAMSGRDDDVAFTRIGRAHRAPDPDQVRRLAASYVSGRGVVVAGPVPDPQRVGPAVLRFAARVGFPVLADPLSGARFGPADGALRVAAYDFALRSEEARAALRPDVVVRVGASPTSATLGTWLLESHGASHIVVDEGDRWKDHAATATDVLTADPVATLEMLGERVVALRDASGPEVGADATWLDRWAAVDEAARAVLRRAETDGEPSAPVHDGAVWAPIARAVPAAAVFVSNSMPVRDLDVFAVPDERSWTVIGNRGASGIDGIVSAAFGVDAGSAPDRADGSPTVCVIGDLAFFHDQNGLLWSREADLSVVFVLIDNDGGGIFHMLPIADHEPDFTRYFATPHGLDFRHAAALHGIELRDATPATLEEEVRRAVVRGGTQVVRVRTDRHAGRLRRAALATAVADAARGALERIARSATHPTIEENDRG